MRLTEEQWQQIIADRNQKRQGKARHFRRRIRCRMSPKKTKQRGVKGVIRQSSRQPNKTEIRFETTISGGLPVAQLPATT